MSGQHLNLLTLSVLLVSEQKSLCVCVCTLMAFTSESLLKGSSAALSHKGVCLRFLLVCLWFNISHFY